MILPFQSLRTIALQYSLNWEHISSASVDLTLRPEIIERWAIPVEAPGSRLIDVHGQYQDNPHWFVEERKHDLSSRPMTFHPGRLYIASTVEQFAIPPDCSALILMRSSYARKGVSHLLAGFGDPGFGHTDGQRSQYTLELYTMLPIEISDAERMVQAVFFRLEAPTMRPYKGKYQGQQGPTPAYKEEE